jgi:hypothetical protein
LALPRYAAIPAAISAITAIAPRIHAHSKLLELVGTGCIVVVVSGTVVVVGVSVVVVAGTVVVVGASVVVVTSVEEVVTYFVVSADALATGIRVATVKTPRTTT